MDRFVLGASSNQFDAITGGLQWTIRLHSTVQLQKICIHMLGLCIVFHQSLSSSRNSACSSTLRFKVCKRQISSSLCCTLSSFSVIHTHMKENDRKTDVGGVIQGRAVKSFGQLNFCRTRYKPNCLFCAYTSKHVSVVGFPLGSSRRKCRFSEIKLYY